MQIDMATVTAFTSFLLALFAIFGYVLKIASRINDKADKEKVSEQVREIHAKIEHVKDRSVRRDELDVRLRHIEDGIARLDDKTDKLVEGVLKAVQHHNGDH